ncbi:hypothetical protein JNM87_02985 [Candidatus Saccharibacteria bacterium]|nr:hypothetical protein [Candidatus Saccharibacteria bacterium]
MNWLPLAFIAPLLFAVFQALSKIMPKGTSPYLVNAYASLVGFVLMLSLYFSCLMAKNRCGSAIKPYCFLWALAA